MWSKNDLDQNKIWSVDVIWATFVFLVPPLKPFRNKSSERSDGIQKGVRHPLFLQLAASLLKGDAIFEASIMRLINAGKGVSINAKRFHLCC